MKLEIVKFGPIENSIFDIKDVNIFIGESATGKSIITKLIYISNTFIRFIISKGTKDSNTLNTIQNLKESFRNSYFNIFKDTYKNFDFTYYYTDEKFVRFTHSNKSQYKVEFSDELKREIETAYTNFKKRFENLEQNNIESDSMLPSIYGLILFQEIKKVFTKDNYIYIPARRSFFTMLSKNIFSIIENGVEIDYIFTQFGRLFQNTKKEFENLNKKISKKDLLFIENRYKELLKGTYAFEDDEDRIYINKDEFLPLNQISSGQQELLPALLILLSVLNSKTSTTIIFEEPEAHLFPKDQQRLVELLIYILNHTQSGNRLIITTHSPYILSVLNNLIYAGKLKSKFIDENLYLHFENISAYSLSNNKAKSILNKENNLIDANYIDDVSNDIANIFDKLLDEEYGE
mgnify:FL=1